MISPGRLAQLIHNWQHDAAVARASLRSDDYAVRCQETAEALRELEKLRSRNNLHAQGVSEAAYNLLLARNAPELAEKCGGIDELTAELDAQLRLWMAAADKQSDLDCRDIPA